MNFRSPEKFILPIENVFFFSRKFDENEDVSENQYFWKISTNTDKIQETFGNFYENQQFSKCFPNFDVTCEYRDLRCYSDTLVGLFYDGKVPHSWSWKEHGVLKKVLNIHSQSFVTAMHYTLKRPLGWTALLSTGGKLKCIHQIPVLSTWRPICICVFCIVLMLNNIVF